MRETPQLAILDDHAHSIRLDVSSGDRRRDQLALGLDLELLQLERRLGAVRRAELDARVREMTRDRVLAQAKPLGDLSVGQAVGGKLEHLDFAVRESGSTPSLGDNARPPTELVIASRKPNERVVCPRRTQSSERLDGGEPGAEWRRRVVDVPQRNVKEDIGPAGGRSELDYRLTAHPQRCDPKRGVGRDLRRNEDWPPPSGRFEEHRQPASDPRVWIQCCHPREGADLCPRVANPASGPFGAGEITRTSRNHRAE